MKRALLFLVFLLLLTNISALNEDLVNKVERISTNIEISSKLTLESTSQNYAISFSQADLSFLPLERENQQVISIEYEPEPLKKGSSNTVFRWDNPSLGEYNYRISAELLNSINRKKVRTMIGFPIKHLPAEYEIYTKATENIDSNDPEIVRIASELAEGEDDMYIVVNKLVSWIKENINYSLDTSTAEVSQSASWVIKNRYGVCDEITSLFIAMARSLGIPAKYVSGVAYTNWNEINDWGPHAWAEVYYPGVGWVAYDITYNEFGYVDATHIVLKESLDSNEASTNYEWSGRNVDLVPDKINIKTELLGKSGTAEDLIRIEVAAYKEEVGFGSYDIIEAKIKNLQGYYVSEDISLAKVNEMELFESEDQQIVLRPLEEKKIYWLVRVSDKLDRNYIYTLPVTVYSARNITGGSKITSKYRTKVYPKSDMQAYIDERTEEELKRYSKDISFECSADKEAKQGELIHVDCEASNEGNVYIKDLKVCLGNECKTFDLGISKSNPVSFEVKAEDVGENDISVKASNMDVSKTVHLNVLVFDEPQIKITNLEYNKTLGFGEELKLKFLLDKISLSNPLDTRIKITRDNIVNKWDFGDLNQSQDFVISFDTKGMQKENSIEILVEYSDEEGKDYSAAEEISVVVEASKFFDKFRLWFNKWFWFI